MNDNERKLLLEIARIAMTLARDHGYYDTNNIARLIELVETPDDKWGPAPRFTIIRGLPVK